ncbi:dUTP diphosphatase [uncultured Sulfitobacter sp.]|uniref:dUTP diphosphatase n=1 Tax=uncultured Sulfitobacter sp. TaxID=191468 RepID=UPI00261BA390|nr:dUTP diphosphatase [uncultured Sulfitobacter sp.]
MTIRVKFKRISGNDLPLPSYATEGAAGMDLRAFLPNGPMRIEPGTVTLISTGFCVELPLEAEMQIRPRSSLALKRRIIIPNSPATIDSDYRGQVFVGLYQLGEETTVIEHGDRFAQAVIAPVIRADVVEVEVLSDTARGSGGFGSTGRT